MANVKAIKPTKNIISISGGKDSQATALVALEQGAENLEFVFADTGNEQQQTYDHLDYLEEKLGHKIHWVKANFADRIAKKRETVQTKWRKEGVGEGIINDALSVLHPTGNAFLDLCLWKGRFPSTKSPFCSIELKNLPLTALTEKYIFSKKYKAVVSWQGVRRDESFARRNALEWEAQMGCVDKKEGWLIHRPIVDWTAKQVVDYSLKHGVKLNPLYSQGATRVGCMPCINVRKSELAHIAQRFPEELERISEWERIASAASKRGCTTFLHTGKNIIARSGSDIHYTTHGIKAHIEWAKTCRGSDQYDLLLDAETKAACSSELVVCE